MTKGAEILDLGINTEIAAELLTRRLTDSPDDLLSIYAENTRPVDTVDVVTKEPSVRALYMSELLIGHQDAAVDFYEDTVDKIAALPKDMKPHIAVVSGFMQGDFKFLEKPRRATLVPQLNSMDKQFQFARTMLERLQDAGVRVVYNMSNDDRRIAEEYTIEVFRKMFDYARQQDGVNWAKVDKMRQHPQWNTHYQFQLETVFPYCLRSGRRLYTAQEMAEKTGGAIAQEEYFVLFNAEQATKSKQRIPKTHSDWLREVKATQNTDLVITDDVDVHVKTKGRSYTDSVRHYMGFSPQPMYQNHMQTSVNAVANLAANGRPVPDMFVTQHNQEEVGVSHQGAWVISTGGLIRARNFLHASGSRSDARGDVSRRLVTTRRRIPEPSASMHERTDDGRHIVTFMNDALNEKSFSLAERMTIAELCDLQTGSITARPDMLARYLDYIRTRSIGERATAIFFGGDMMHGRNYPNFPSESQVTGLMSMDSQEDFNVQMFQEAFKHMGKDELDGLIKILVQPGNHEWNSGTVKWHGYSFTTYMRNLFEKMYARAGYSDEEIAKIVKSHDAVVTPKGEYVSGYTGLDYFGDYGVLIQHYLLERGGKGSGGDLPVYQTHHYATGAGDLMKNTDILMAGHWHHPQYGMFGDKLGLVGGSMAGLSDYEMKRGYRPTIAGTLIHLGGGLPVQVEFISEEALRNHKIKNGGFSDATLKHEGYKTDRDFDAERHGIYMPDKFPKSALQKKILAIGREASQRTKSLVEIR